MATSVRPACGAGIPPASPPCLDTSPTWVGQSVDDFCRDAGTAVQCFDADGSGITLPAQPLVPPLAVQLSALLTDQDRVVVPPSSIESGLAAKEPITTVAGGSTVTVVFAVSDEPEVLEHCSVKT